MIGQEEGYVPSFRVVVKSPRVGAASAERVLAADIGEEVTRWVRQGFIPADPGEHVTVDIHFQAWELAQ